jgi:hypothetical protein
MHWYQIEDEHEHEHHCHYFVGLVFGYWGQQIANDRRRLVKTFSSERPKSWMFQTLDMTRFSRFAVPHHSSRVT